MEFAILPSNNLLELNNNAFFQGDSILLFMTIVTICFPYTKVLYPFHHFLDGPLGYWGVMTPVLKAGKQSSHHHQKHTFIEH